MPAGRHTPTRPRGYHRPARERRPRRTRTPTHAVKPPSPPSRAVSCSLSRAQWVCAARDPNSATSAAAHAPRFLPCPPASTLLYEASYSLCESPGSRPVWWRRLICICAARVHVKGNCVGPCGSRIPLRGYRPASLGKKVCLGSLCLPARHNCLLAPFHVHRHRRRAEERAPGACAQ